MSYNFFQDALNEGKVILQAQPAYVPSVIKDQSVYNTQTSNNNGVSEDIKLKLRQKGYSDQEIIQLEQQLKEKQQAPAPAPAPAQEQGYLDTAIQGVKDFGAGVSAAGTQAAGGALSIASDIVAAPFSDTVSYGGIFRGDNTGGPGQFFRDETKRQLAQGAEAFGANTNNLTYNVGKTGAGIGLAAVTPGGILGKAKDVGMLGKVGLGAAQGAIETGKFNALTEGRIGTAGELATGAAFGGALPIVGAGLGKAKNYVTTKLPESLIATGIATSSKLLNASERLNKLGYPSLQDATSVSKWLLGNKIAGDLEQRTTQLADLAKTSRESAQTLLKGNTTTVADDIALQAKKGLETLRTKLEGAGLDKYVSYIDDALAKGTWTAEDLNKARTFMADKGGIFKHSGDWVDSLQKENLQDIWKASSKYLDETIPGFRTANKDYEVASALGEAIKLKQAQDIGRQVFSLVNVTGAGLGGTIGGLTTGGDPMSILKGAALGVGGRYIFSPANMSKLALKLSEYAPKTEAGKIAKAIEAFVVSRGGKEIPTKYVDIIKNASQATKPVKSTSLIKPTQAKKPQKALITK